MVRTKQRPRYSKPIDPAEQLKNLENERRAKVENIGMIVEDLKELQEQMLYLDQKIAEVREQIDKQRQEQADEGEEDFFDELEKINQVVSNATDAIKELAAKKKRKVCPSGEEEEAYDVDDSSVCEPEVIDCE